MKIMRRTVRRAFPELRRGDEGAILIVAILIITVVALVTGALLTRGDGSLRATVALRDVANSTYAADGAAQIALNNLRTGYWDGNATKPSNWAFTNEVGDGCFGRNVTDSILSPAETITLPNFYPAAKGSGDSPTSAYVECVPETATGAQGTARLVNNQNSPGDAIITLAAPGEVGLGKTNKTLKVRGGIKVNSNIVATNEPIEVDSADVRARGCTGTINVSPGKTKNCSAGAVSDPGFPADIDTIPALRTPPTSCQSNVAVFEPGYYDDVAALNAATNICTLAWFKPGTYYFDFHNRSSNGDPLYESAIASGSSNLWVLSGKVLAGTPVDGEDAQGRGTGTGNVLSAPVASKSLPGRCQTPIGNATAAGVQFIFGGDSRVQLSGTAEFCASYRANRPPIVMYGYQGGSNPMLTQLTGATAMTTAADATATAAGTQGTFVGGTQAALQGTGNGSALWQRSGTGNATRTLTMTGFQPSQVVPKGAVIKEARLIVRHRNTGTASNAASIVITPLAPGASALNSFNLNRPAALTDQTFNLKTGLSPAQWSVFARGVHDFGYTGAAVAYSALLPAGQVAEVDSVKLELEYYVPQMRGPSAISGNCITVVGSGGCNQIGSPANGQGELYLQGTTYLPQGRIDLEIKNTDAQIFRWGVISRSLQININGAFDYTGAVIELPDNSPGLGLDGTLVQMKVYVCPGQATCSASGRLALLVRAQIWDEDADATTIDDREVTILNWSHTR